MFDKVLDYILSDRPGGHLKSVMAGFVTSQEDSKYTSAFFFGRKGLIRIVFYLIITRAKAESGIT